MRAISLVLLAMAVGGTAHGAPKPRVFVADGKGAIAYAIDGPLKTALKARKEIELVSAEEAKSAAAIVESKTAREPSGQWVATIEVREAATGAVKKTWRLKAKEAKKISGAIETRAWKELGAAIMRARSGAHAPPREVKPPEVAKAENDKAEEPPEAPKKEEGPKPWKDLWAEEGRTSKPAAPRSASRSGPATATVAAGGGGFSGGFQGTVSSSSDKPAQTAAVEIGRPAEARAHNETPLEIFAGFDYLTRSFKYNQDLFGKLRPYTLSGVPEIAAGGAWYPAAHFTSGFAAHLGLEASFQYALGLSSKNTSGVTFSTHTLELAFGARARLPLGEHELALSIGGGKHAFDLSSDASGASPGVPSIDYGFLRLGVEGRFVLFPHFSVRARAAWRRVLSKGDIQSDAWFPGASAVGGDALVGMGYEFIDGLEVQIGFEAKRYAFSFNPIPGDKNVAGGAVDQYFVGSVNLAYALAK